MKTRLLFCLGILVVFLIYFSGNAQSGYEADRPDNRPNNPPRLMREFFFTCLGGCISGGIGFLVGWWLNRLERDKNRMKEKQIRKQNFRCMLAELSSKIERLSGLPEPKPIEELFKNYIFFVHDFHKERVKVAGDFLPEQEFINLCNKFGRLKYEDITKDPKQRAPRDVIAESLKAIIDFTNAS